MECLCGVWVQVKVELVFLMEFEVCFGQCVVVDLCVWVVFGEVGGMGGDFVGDDFGFYIIFVWQIQVFFGCDVVEYGVVELVDYCCVDVGGDVVVVGGDVGGQWVEGVEWCFVIVFQLFVYVFFD